MTGPTITALCLTRNRKTWLPRAIECFKAQTYAHKKLLILADGEDVSSVVPNDPRISLVTLLEDERPKTIGHKRNVGCAMIETDLICHWDDDDWSAPERMADQARRLTESGLSVTGYQDLEFRDGPRRHVYHGAILWAAGTSLMYKRTWWEQHPFMCVDIGEDNDFVDKARGHKQIIVSPGGDLMWAAIHMGNTSKKTTDGHMWTELPRLL